MGKRFLLGCFEVPGWGGASTSRYKLFERLQRDAFEIGYVNLVSAPDATYFRFLFGDGFANPRGLANVHTCVLSDPLWRPHASLADLIDELEPDLLIGCGYIATLLFHLSAPRIPVVFVTTGCKQLQTLVERGAARDFIGFQRAVECGVVFPIMADNERRAVEVAELIIPHSPLVRFAFDHFFAGYAGRVYDRIVSVADLIYPEAETFAHHRRPFVDRDIDVLFVASSWARPEKNYALVRRLIAAHHGWRMDVVGEVPNREPRAQYHGVVTGRDHLYALLGRTRVVACPSLVDAAPGILFEASAMGCNVVASRNCGNWQLCHEALLASACSAQVFDRALRTARNAPCADGREHFRGGYDDFIETLQVV